MGVCGGVDGGLGGSLKRGEENHLRQFVCVMFAFARHIARTGRRAVGN